MEQVFYKLDIVEKDYFGLQYTDAHNVPHWLDPTKPVKKQVKSKLQKHNINSVHKEKNIFKLSHTNANVSIFYSWATLYIQDEN